MAPAHDSNTYVEHGKRVFERIDVHKSGSVNLEQFIDCCIKVSDEKCQLVSITIDFKLIPPKRKIVTEGFGIFDLNST